MNNSLINDIYNSVVRIEANVIEYVWTAPFVKSKAPTGSGSGFLIDNLGHIVTCFHVINQAIHLFVTLPKSGQERIPAKIVAIYPEMDMAIIKIDSNINKITSFLELGDSDKIKIGKEVLAIGYPLGQDKLKITKGIVSGIQNTYIQTDAPINPGNSGGPLLYDGKVIGINTAKIAQVGTEGVGFANPINIFLNVKKRMLSKKDTLLSSNNTSIVSYIKDDIVRIESSSLGILVDKTTKQIMQFNYCECPSGIQITKIFENSPLRTGTYPAKDGDILCSIQNYPIDNNGECTVPWNREKVDYNDVFNRISLSKNTINVTYYTILENTKVNTIKNIPIYKTIGKLISKTIPIVSSKQIFKIWHYYPPYDDIKYVAFGGLVMMNLTMNHILMENFRHLFYNYINKLDQSVVIITTILPSTPHIDNILNVGDVVKEINGIPIQKIEDVDIALKQPVYKQNNTGQIHPYFTIKTGLDKFYCISLKTALKEDIGLIQYLNYTPSEATKYFIKNSNDLPYLNLNTNNNTDSHYKY